MATIANMGQRTQTDFIPIGQQTAYKMFHSKVIEFEQECVQKKKPFCRKCVIDEWNDKYNQKLKQVQRKAMSRSETDSVGDIEFNSEIKFEEFTEPHFSLKDEGVKEWETKAGKIMKAFYLNFVCKKYGYGNAITLSELEYDAWKQKSVKNKS